MSEVNSVDIDVETGKQHNLSANNDVTSDTEFHLNAIISQSDNKLDLTMEQQDDCTESNKELNLQREFDDVDAGISTGNNNSAKMTSFSGVIDDVHRNEIAEEMKPHMSSTAEDPVEEPEFEFDDIGIDLASAARRNSGNLTNTRHQCCIT